MLTVPLDCPFLIAPSVFANAYQNIQSVILFIGQKLNYIGLVDVIHLFI